MSTPIVYTLYLEGSDGNPLPGLAPQWVVLYRTSDGSIVDPPPPIAEGPHRLGIYHFGLDVEAEGDCVGLVDLGVQSALLTSRYLFIQVFRSDYRTGRALTDEPRFVGHRSLPRADGGTWDYTVPEPPA